MRVDQPHVSPHQRDMVPALFQVPLTKDRPKSPHDLRHQNARAPNDCQRWHLLRDGRLTSVFFPGQL